MEEEKRIQTAKECKRKCTCEGSYQTSRGRQRRSQSQVDNEYSYSQEQKTFMSFVTETISIIAFIFFGSIVFWLAVAGVLFDFLKRLYKSDRYVKLFVAGLFTLLLLSMTVRLALNKRVYRAQFIPEKIKADTEANKVSTAPTEQLKPPPEHLQIILKDKKLRNDCIVEDRNITINFTLTIEDEKKKEVFKTSKIFFIPEMAMEMKRPPALIVYLKELILEIIKMCG